MKKIKLTETELTQLIQKVIEEQNLVSNTTGNDRIANLANTIRSLKVVNKPVKVISSTNPKLNNMKYSDYVKMFKITPQEIAQANQLLSKMGVQSTTKTIPQQNPFSSKPPQTKSKPVSTNVNPTGSTMQPTPQVQTTSL